MRQLTVKYTIRITEAQSQSLKKLQRYDVNVGNFIRQAIKDKIRNDWPKIKERESKLKTPF